MNPVNKVLSLFGLRLSRISKAIKQIDSQEKDFMANYEYYFKQVENNKRGFKAFKNHRYEAGEHPSNNMDLVCEFAAYHLFNTKPKNVLDIGAWRQFIMLVCCLITT